VTLNRTRTFMETKVAPVINKYWVEGAFPFELWDSAHVRGFQEETTMKWTTPRIVETAVGLEINSYACAELN
jgi:coenzyme PQQ precursor peptide PqqA